MIYRLDFSIDLIEFLSQRIFNDYQENKEDISSLGIVFPGRRPRLYLNASLAKKFGKPLFAPRVFSIQDFIEDRFLKLFPGYRKIPLMDACFILFRLIRSLELEEFIWHRELEFDRFFLWAKKILEFIEEMDKEGVSKSELINIEKNAQIGYDVPLYINRLLENISRIREGFHERLAEKKFYTPGFCYFKLSENLEAFPLDDFSKLYLAGFFALSKCEKIIFRHILRQKKAEVIIQRDDGDWKILDELEGFLRVKVECLSSSRKRNPEIKIYEGFDSHSQIEKSLEVLSNLDNLEYTCIVFSNEEILISFLLEASEFLHRGFNISLGYPLKRTPLASLLEAIFLSQEHRTEDGSYYSRDYLKIIMHPYVKNIGQKRMEATATRILIHKIEEELIGLGKGSFLEKRPFIKLEDIEALDALYQDVVGIIDLSQRAKIKSRDLKEIIVRIHNIFFHNFEKIRTFKDFIRSIEEVLRFILEESLVSKYVFSANIFNRFFEILEELDKSIYKDKIEFSLNSLFEFFRFYLEFERLPFKGSPLRGTQILGMLETRCLNFKNVIIFDVNEGNLPQVFESDPLIPRGVLAQLGLANLYHREEIFRYHFFRLIKSAENVYLFYKNIPEEKQERSRFIEEIIWEKEKQKNRLLSEGEGFLNRIEIPSLIIKRDYAVSKNENIMRILKKMTLSPSSIDVYLRCPLKFYFRYILGLKEKEGIVEEIEADRIGKFFHELFRDFYSHFINQEVKIQKLQKQYLQERKKELFIKYFKDYPEAFLLKEMVDYVLGLFIKKEQERKERITVLFVEKVFPEGGKFVTFPTPYGEMGIKGIMDRVDERSTPDKSYVHILDYKTGLVRETILNKKKFDVSSRKNIKESISSFQLPLYLYIYRSMYNLSWNELNASFYCIRNLDNPSKSEIFLFAEGEEREKIMENYFIPALRMILGEMMNPEVSFMRDTSDEHLCKRCSYQCLCRK